MVLAGWSCDLSGREVQANPVAKFRVNPSGVTLTSPGCIPRCFQGDGRHLPGLKPSLRFVTVRQECEGSLFVLSDYGDYLAQRHGWLPC
jgi:hypothetical protein